MYANIYSVYEKSTNFHTNIILCNMQYFYLYIKLLDGMGIVINVRTRISLRFSRLPRLFQQKIFLTKIVDNTQIIVYCHYNSDLPIKTINSILKQAGLK